MTDQPSDWPRWTDAIDVHHHVVPPFYRDAVTDDGRVSPIRDVDYPHWTREDSLEVMENQGIATAVVSITVPGVDTG